jgi:hypothetical protein
MKLGKVTSTFWGLAIVGVLAAPATADTGNFSIPGVACIAKDPDRPDLIYYSNGAIASENSTNTQTIMCALPLSNGTWNTGDSVGVTISGAEGTSGNDITCWLRVSGDFGNQLLLSTSGTLNASGQVGFTLTETLNYASQHATAFVYCNLPAEPSGNANKPKIYGARGTHSL